MNYDTPAWRAVQAADDAGQVAFALALLRRLLAEHPEHWPARLLLGKLLAQVARHQDAREVLDALADDPVSSGNRTRWLLYGAVADLDDRAGRTEDALRGDPRYVDAKAALDDVAAALRSIALAPGLPR